MSLSKLPYSMASRCTLGQRTVALAEPTLSSSCVYILQLAGACVRPIFYVSGMAERPHRVRYTRWLVNGGGELRLMFLPSTFLLTY